MWLKVDQIMKCRSDNYIGRDSALEHQTVSLNSVLVSVLFPINNNESDRDLENIKTDVCERQLM